MRPAPKLTKIKLIVSHGSKWGPGKTHVADNDPYALCGRHVYGEPTKGTIEDVTCKNCIKRYWGGR